MYSVEADKSKPLVVISAVGQVTRKEAKQAAQRTRDILKDFAPGFRVLTDFRWLQSMDTAAARHVAEIMDTLTEKQVASVIRVMPDPHKDIASIFSRSFITVLKFKSPPSRRWLMRCKAW